MKITLNQLRELISEQIKLIKEAKKVSKKDLKKMNVQQLIDLFLNTKDSDNGLEETAHDLINANKNKIIKNPAYLSKLYLNKNLAFDYMKNPLLYDIFDEIKSRGQKNIKESQASEEAKKKGLEHAGFGKYKNDSGKVVAQSKDGKLVPVKNSNSMATLRDKGELKNPGSKTLGKQTKLKFPGEPKKNEVIKKEYKTKDLMAKNPEIAHIIDEYDPGEAVQDYVKKNKRKIHDLFNGWDEGIKKSDLPKEERGEIYNWSDIKNQLDNAIDQLELDEDTVVTTKGDQKKINICYSSGVGNETFSRLISMSVDLFPQKDGTVKNKVKYIQFIE